MLMQMIWFSLRSSLSHGLMNIQSWSSPSNRWVFVVISWSYGPSALFMNLKLAMGQVPQGLDHGCKTPISLLLMGIWIWAFGCNACVNSHVSQLSITAVFMLRNGLWTTVTCAGIPLMLECSSVTQQLITAAPTCWLLSVAPRLGLALSSLSWATS